jgi:hypothetical protein
MNDLSDRELRAHFDALRAEDAPRAPAFTAVRDRATSVAAEDGRAPRRHRLGVLLSIAAAVLIAAGVARISLRSETPLQPLSTWRSPTAALLDTPGSELFASSALFPSALDQLASMSSQQKGK